MGYVTYRLDEDRPFSDAGWTLDVLVYGEATIQYRSECDWWLEKLVLDASNGSGGTYEASSRPINKASALFMIISEYLGREQSDDIAEMIRDDIRDQSESRLFDEGKERAKLRAVSL